MIATITPATTTMPIVPNLMTAKNIAEHRARLCTDGVYNHHEYENQDCEPLLVPAPSLACIESGHKGFVNRFHKNNAHNGERGWHHASDPVPGGKETSKVPVHVSQVRLKAALTGKGGAELGHGGCACPGEKSSGEPYQ